MELVAAVAAVASVAVVAVVAAAVAVVAVAVAVVALEVAMVEEEAMKGTQEAASFLAVVVTAASAVASKARLTDKAVWVEEARAPAYVTSQVIPQVQVVAWWGSAPEGRSTSDEIPEPSSASL